MVRRVRARGSSFPKLTTHKEIIVSNFKTQDVAALIEAFEHSGAQELRVLTNGLELQLSKTPGGMRQVGTVRSADMRPPTTVAGTAPAAPALDSASASAPTGALAPAAEPAHKVAPAGHQFIRAANLGTFYRSPKPGAPSYVEVGTKVQPDTEVCLIEVMKLFTPLIAGTHGTVREVLVSDGALVEFDQPLFLIQVDA